jgi:hypothetical protein
MLAATFTVFSLLTAIPAVSRDDWVYAFGGLSVFWSCAAVVAL